MLYLIVFLSGAVLMGLEMIGSRLLAPTFGTSIYVWGALITVVMAALTLGYYLGGRMADRRPSLGVMGLILALAGLLVGFLPVWSASVNQALAGLGPRAGSLLAAVAFFFLPSTLLASISPYSVKLASRSLTTIGKTAGRLSALSSAGSILGTLVTSFFLIPALGVRNIVHMLGLILLLLAAAALTFARRQHLASETGEPVRQSIPRAKHGDRGPAATRPSQIAIDGGLSSRSRLASLTSLLLLFAALILVLVWRFVVIEASPHPPGSATILYSRDTLYHHITVDDYQGVRHLHFDNSFQSGMYLDDPLRMAFAYTSYLHLGVVARPRPERMLFIGLGGGSAPARFLHDYPSLRQVDVVEIDPEVVNVARRFFRLPDDPRLRIIVQDGRLFVEQAAAAVRAGRAQRYDLIVVDAYFADAIPYHLTTYEFISSLDAILARDGAVVSNIIGALAGPKARLLASMTRTFAQVFPTWYLFPVGGWSGPGDWGERNVILIANRSARRWDRLTWQQEAAKLREQGDIQEPVELYADTLVDDVEWTDKRELAARAAVLTDDYAPVDTLQHPL
ncbi:MAG TPA: fused MFS/spermidine synthase [Firmicutes bacterium]|nr:fused MFS/spermidine synthase [Bacillota bacterium]